MELCSIEDAFPKLTDTSKRQPAPGCTDSKSSKEERRAARRRAKECKTRSYDYLNVQDDVAVATAATPETDPDRPAIKRLGEVSAFVDYEDAFPDVSGSLEGFKVPPTTTPPKLNTGLPKYFGGGDDDEAVEGFTDMQPRSQLDMPGYNTNPQTIEGGFDQRGVSRAGSSSGLLPDPSLNDAWKPLTEAKATTAFHQRSRRPERVEPSGESPLAVNIKQKEIIPTEFPSPYHDPDDTEKIEMRVIAPKTASRDITRDALLRKVKDLTARLEDLEQRNTRNSQTDVLMFVGTGLFLLISFDLILRTGKN